LDSRDYEEAAKTSNLCRRAGIIGSSADMLMFSVALRRDWEIFTVDHDFVHHARVVRIRLLNAVLLT